MSTKVYAVKISIITVCYNCKDVINSCLTSVENQKNAEVEHIVIDGASTDGTLQILESRRSQLKALISEPDKGIYHAMNKGLKIATGEIVGFLNADDFYASNNILSKVSHTFTNNPSIDACYADLIYVNRFNTIKTIRYWKSSEFIPGLFSKGWSPPHPTFFVKKSIYKKYGNFDLKYSIASDTELMMRFLEIYRISSCYIPEIWVKMRTGGTSNKSIKNIYNQNKEVLNALKNNNISVSLLNFFICKFFSRSLQFLNRN